MTSTSLTFDSVEAHRAWLASQSALPEGFRCANTRFEFVPVEVHKPSKMTLTLISLDQPTDSFAAMFTRNAFPGAPVIVGRARLRSSHWSAILINNKISNVCAPDGVTTAERICEALATQLDIPVDQVLPCSTGVIGWQLPESAIISQLPSVVSALQSESVLPAAEGIVTTDLYPKVRSVTVGQGRIVGIAKGAGMIEPKLATMLVYLLTDLDIDRETLQQALRDAVEESFHCMSIDSDTSTSDTVIALSSRRKPLDHLQDFRAALTQVCRDLTEDIVRNGEGVHHVLRVHVKGAPSVEIAREVGKSIVNSPLFQCAVCGNDPNVGRLVMAIGKYLGEALPHADLSRCAVSMGGCELLRDGIFHLDPASENALVAHMRAAELYASVPPPDGLTFVPAVRFPPHERCVEITVSLGLGESECTVLGADRTHEYISENADYRT
ncbi:MAG: bifunctional ornithine acetyltransferase/N-acetylglutamate synthase [Deltaproteobacteria bacterium]|nr:bifunctional ornithine acetyltransferase/N-acetylglutamate synthase [Deltaproteobacteria bacterium]